MSSVVSIFCAVVGILCLCWIAWLGWRQHKVITKSDPRKFTVRSTKDGLIVIERDVTDDSMREAVVRETLRTGRAHVGIREPGGTVTIRQVTEREEDK